MVKFYTFALLSITSLTSFAAIPVRWTTDAYKVKPLVYECYHGETLDLAASLTAYGEPLNLAGKTARLYWQTNGMESAWWSTNAFVRAESGATNVLAAVWSGAYDTGSERVTGFIGLEGENYRASFELKFRASPGFSPSLLPMPTKTIDWANVANSNIESAPFALKGEGGGGMTTNAVISISANQVTNNVAQWALAGHTEPQGMSGATATNIAQNVIQINIDTNLLCTVSAAQAMTNGLATSFHGGVLSYLSFDSSQKVHTDWPITSAASVDGGTLIGLAYNDFSGFYANVNGAETSLPDYITSTSVTNGGAVAAAKAYADGKFLQKTGGDVSGAINAYGALNTYGGIVNYGTYLAFTEMSYIYTYSWEHLFSQTDGESGQSLPTYLSSLAWHPSNKTLTDYGITNTIPVAVSDSHITNIAEAVSASLYETNDWVSVTNGTSKTAMKRDVPTNYLKSATSTDTSITVTKQDDTTVGLEVQYVYALTNLTAATLSLRSGEIGNYATAADFTLNLDFADNGMSGDCLLYVANTDTAADHTITLTPNTYTFVSADIAKARTLGKATTNIVSFTRVNSTTVLVAKQEVK